MEVHNDAQADETVFFTVIFESAHDGTHDHLRYLTDLVAGRETFNDFQDSQASSLSSKMI